MPIRAVDRTAQIFLFGSVFAVFLLTRKALSALPLYILDGLGFGAFEVGIASGAQFASALVGRLFAGSFSDRRDPKWSMLIGLGSGAVAGGGERLPP